MEPSTDIRAKAAALLERYRQDDPVTGCWVWTGCKLPTGHGQARLNGRGYLTHRLSAWLYLGLDIENRYMGSRRDASQVNHRCANPSCFNPEHLYVGSQRDNIHDIPSDRRGLGALPLMGHCRRGHPHDPATYKKTVGCHICRKASCKAWKARHPEYNVARNARRRVKRPATVGEFTV